MKLSNCSTRDANMYLSNTYCLFEGTPILINNICYTYENEEIDYRPSKTTVFDNYKVVIDYTTASTNKNILTKSIDYNLPLIPITLGYRQVDNYVVFLYRKQGNSAKKLPTLNTIYSFLPQKQEFSYLTKEYKYSTSNILLTPPEYTHIDDAYKILQDKNNFSVALHHNYALVKKGTYQHPVIYYRTDPVIEYTGTEFIPLVDNTHIEKFKLEVGLL